MSNPSPRYPAARRFVFYASLNLAAVLVLGFAIALSLRAEARHRGLREARAQAQLIAQSTVEPSLSGRPLSGGLEARTRGQLDRLIHRAIVQRDVLRLRIRTLSGRVVYAAAGSARSAASGTAAIDDEALDAARGQTVAILTHLDADDRGRGDAGVSAVEVYLPLRAGAPSRRVGVLELYLPYARIDQDVTAGLRELYLDLGLGLLVLCLALCAISASVSRGLRREARHNKFLAEHDQLTGLPNRVSFQRRAAEALSVAADSGGRVAIALADLDRFKHVNDTLGHGLGDRLLVEIADRLTAHVSSTTTVARLGGDEFGFVLPGATDPRHALGELRRVVEQELDIAGLRLSVEASFGYVIGPEDGAEVDPLLRRADVAMYAAKSRRAGVIRYDPTLEQHDAGTLELAGELPHAIDAGQLVLHYQPQTLVQGGQTTAVEALVRWQHPEHGLLPPVRFLPFAEQTGVMDKLTRWVLFTALREVADLPRGDAGPISVSVNVSARSIVDPAFARLVLDALAQTEVSPNRLTIEVTETVMLSDPTRAALVLGELAAAGVDVSLDDFGHGQTSLRYLSALPLHELKIDKSFVMSMGESSAQAAIVRSLVELGHNLGLRVVGEGVESAELLATLRECDCDVAQGFGIARPMPMQALGAWLATRADDRAPTTA